MENADLQPTHQLPDTIYHYCGVSALHGILTSRQLWLSNVHFMNDYREQAHLITEAEKLLQELAKDATGRSVQPLVDDFDKFALTPYACCFSIEGDLLSQWRAYADDGTGFAIGFSSEWLLEQREKHPAPVAVLPIEYEREKWKPQLEFYINWYRVSCVGEHGERAANAKMALLHIWCLSAACKNRGFREEKEVRILTMLPYNRQINTAPAPKPPAISQVCFRVGNGRIIPYFTLTFPQAAIKEIRLGPKNYARKDAFFLRMFLQENGYDCKIVPAEATYGSSE